MIDDNSPSIQSTSKDNIFTGNISSISGLSSPASITPVDPNKFIWSQFFIGLFLIPIFAGVIMSLIILEVDNSNDPYYGDYHYFNENYESGTVLINDEEYNTWEATFEIPEIDIIEIDKKDYWFYTSIQTFDNNWGDCFFNMDMKFTLIESDDGTLWYPMECSGAFENNNAYFQISGQIFIYAIDYDDGIELVSVDGDTDISLDSIISGFLPFLIPIFYLLIMIWSFVKKKKSLGFGLLGGIIVAPISFCFSIILFSFLMFDNGW